MEISFEYANSILKTLPISYYTGLKLEYKLSENDKVSFFDPVNRTITISYLQIESALKNTTISMNDEQLLRTLFYHEVSHAFLTPAIMYPTKILNVFEDERIETLLETFYYNVDFKSFVKKINDFDPTKQPSSAFEMFYDVVRFRHGPKQFTDRVQNIICENAKLVNNTENYRQVAVYAAAVNQLYRDIENYFYSNKQRSKSEVAEQTSQSKQNDSDNTDIDSSTNPTMLSKENEKCLDKAIKNAIEAVTKMITTHVNTTMKTDFELIFNSSKKITSKNSGAIASYSGIFDPRQVIRSDYKYFTQKNRTGHIKQFSRTHLNLFIDCSGSFSASEKVVNDMISTLIEIEHQNPDFDFDLILCGRGQRIMPKNERKLRCNGSNDLSNDIFDQFRQLQIKNAHVVNIVLFDGDAYSGVISYTSKGYTFKAFDTKNTVIISDYQNQEYLNSNVKIAKVILTNDYTSVLYQNIKIALQTLMR